MSKLQPVRAQCFVQIQTDTTDSNVEIYISKEQQLLDAAVLHRLCRLGTKTP